VAGARPLVVIAAAHRSGAPRWGIGVDATGRRGREASARRRVGAAAAVAGLGVVCSYTDATLFSRWCQSVSNPWHRGLNSEVLDVAGFYWIGPVKLGLFKLGWIVVVLGPC
jgi:hypothetical protein